MKVLIRDDLGRPSPSAAAAPSSGEVARLPKTHSVTAEAPPIWGTSEIAMKRKMTLAQCLSTHHYAERVSEEKGSKAQEDKLPATLDEDGRRPSLVRSHGVLIAVSVVSAILSFLPQKDGEALFSWRNRPPRRREIHERTSCAHRPGVDGPITHPPHHGIIMEMR
ncbi:hypothetical protein NHX12_031002 [Muraenolepis orangiensis]|uniref:Uncharacterized protein n=1 Tax=Muraenolepis orangiensis TaxID=630683 RepID=A0A9Q0ED71_9TELE|nr:hypothetical protein NHX12_031002 [Muraenolepis orangiensis]